MNVKTCSICSTRPVPSAKARTEAGMSLDMDYCFECFEEADWENTHSDFDHEGSNAGNTDETDACWICHPELNQAKAEYTTKAGTSRAGMIIHVSMRADGPTKAAQVEEQFKAIETTGEQWEIKTSKPTKRNNHITKLTASSAQETYVLSWDIQGRFNGGTVTEDGKSRKVRNVSEALRLAH